MITLIHVFLKNRQAKIFFRKIYFSFDLLEKYDFISFLNYCQTSIFFCRFEDFQFDVRVVFQKKKKLVKIDVALKNHHFLYNGKSENK